MSSQKNIKTLFLFLCLLIISSVSSQHHNVKLEKPIGATYFAAPCEPCISMNPKNTNEIVVGSVLNGFHFTKDGGKSWTDTILQSSLGVEGDPCIVIDNTGTYHYFHLANPPGGTRLSSIVHQSLTKIDGEWSDGIAIGNNIKKIHDKEWAVVDRSDNSIYLFWTIFDAYKSAEKKHKSNIYFSSFNPNSKKWTEPLRINQFSGDCKDDDNSLVGVNTAVGPNGEVYAAWTGLGKIWFDRSFDKGKTWLKKDLVIAEQPEGWRFSIPGIYRTNGFPAIACDTSETSYRGNIYAVWADQRKGINNTTIFFSKSNDNGGYWSQPKEIYEKNDEFHSFFPAIAIDQTNGKIWIAYYDRKKLTDNQTEVYLAYSEDGGETFDNFRISKSPFIPDKEMFFGDYIAIAAHNNVVRPVWTRLDGFSLSLWTALVDINQIGVDEHYTPDILSGYEENIEIVNSWDLKNSAYDEWSDFQEKWFLEVYRPVLQKFNIEMNCSDCEYAYLDVVLYIDYEGKVVRFYLEKSNFCGKTVPAEIEKELLDSILKNKFSLSLSNKAIRVKLGTGLKC
ncbi:MAG: exo-alpha-sialidase [Bacteroidales bacterium]|nr:exo-alpha-sialidase [Bacteroidales bacterium]